jgi:hypothetical protein
MRENGFYWVKPKSTSALLDHSWFVAEWDDDAWLSPGYEPECGDDAFEEIDERRLTRTTDFLEIDPKQITRPIRLKPT